MSMLKIKMMLRTTLLTLFILSTFFAVAHKPTKPVVKSTVVKGFKPPKLAISLGNYKDSAIITVAEGQQLITTPLKITDAKNGQLYEPFSGFCFETQHHCNSINIPEFPSTLLRPGQVYKHKTSVNNCYCPLFCKQ